MLTLPPLNRDKAVALRKAIRRAAIELEAVPQHREVLEQFGALLDSRLDQQLTNLEAQVFPVLETISNAVGRFGGEEARKLEPQAFHLARKTGLVSSEAERGWFLTERGKRLLEALWHRTAQS